MFTPILGKHNTKRIIQVLGPEAKAVKLCDDLVLSGYDDWFLPSRDELDEMYRHKGIIGGFEADNYWSSSESDYNGPWLRYFYEGYKDCGSEDYLSARVRAVRVF